MPLSKSGFEESLRARFFGSRLFPRLRTAYQFCFNREKLRRRLLMKQLYSRLIQKGDLVFDVGANVGVYSEIFAELGARVIAIEPNPECCRVLRDLGRRMSVDVESCAAGEKSGELILRLSTNSQLSSLNPDWCRTVEASPLHWNAGWQGEILVNVVTLDSLADRHGTPKFVKIDAEGFDDHVMRGISFKPEIITFEYNQLSISVVENCLSAPAIESGYEFNFLNPDTMDYVSSRWQRREDFRQSIEHLASLAPSGDVIARRV
jgi:FkbM family methyltransferase